MEGSASSAGDISVDEIEAEFRKVQDHICEFLVRESGQHFREDRWNYEKGEGGGITRVWEEERLAFASPAAISGSGGAFPLIEKGGVNFSGLHGASMPDSAATQFKIPQQTPYRVTGVSLVIHPYSPHVPTIHMNIRYFECGPRWWFGGGVDVTPYYVNRVHVVGFHKKLKALCGKWGHDYEAMKKQCDEYFHLKHRNEARGVGGIFFDHLTSAAELIEEASHAAQRKTKRELCSFVTELGFLFTSIYAPFISDGRNKEVLEEHKQFQWYRRSRYVEFNLLYDRGTKFGLQSEGRTESILMSMPPTARWRYDWKPEDGTAEAELLEIIKPKDWANM